MEYYPFDSRNPLYRSQIGAIAEGKTLRLRLLLHLDAKVDSAFLLMICDGESEPVEILLTEAEILDNYKFYECELELDEGLYWYAFKYKSEFGEFYVTKTGSSLGTLSEDGRWWQQTVYKKDFCTPDWLKGGIIYQIFPDRFFASKQDKKNVPTDRFMQKDTFSVPEYRQGEDLCHLGNDYYCGDLKGIEEKLNYIKGLGVTCIYLNPIFEAHSNHRYNTADYFKIDSLLGDENDLMSLCKNAEKLGISIILDGVFSHTGDDSIYFNSKGRYDSCGAANSTASPYINWYKFKSYPDDYESWWGVKTLPEINEDNPDFTEFITGENGVLRYWIKKGIKGWRLDVADELPDNFLDNIRKSVKAENKDAYILGEVWEDASNKISYDVRRKFLRGEQLDSVMNYPFADAIIDFIKDKNAERLINTVLDITENYPPEAIALLMNHIGTHDTPRIITNLCHKGKIPQDREWQSKQKLTESEFKHGVKLVKLASVIQYTLPGVPSLYYGDEIALEGYGDPFCRGFFDWSKTKSGLTNHYRKLGKIRANTPVFKNGTFAPVKSENGVLAFARESDASSALTVINNTESELSLKLPQKYQTATPNFNGKILNKSLILPSLSAEILTI
ncbi:MAG: alpha-amylase family glycosyl hydrolase [Oscillospiraceae bacterium]|nr:alpha-amylase family glycosyl hydrolase [Oscillospiraceae bacterium]